MALKTGVMTRAFTPNLHEPGLRNVLFNEYDLYDDEYQFMYDVDGSDKAQEHDWVGSPMSTFGKVDEGEEVTFDTMQEAYKKTFTHLCFGKGIMITRIAQQDDLYGFTRANALVKELGRTAKYTKNVMAMSVLNDSTTTNIYTLDGVSRPLLSTTHQRVDGGTWSNRFAAHMPLGVESIELALTQFRTDMLDHRGRPQMIPPKYLVVAPGQEFVARRLLESALRPFTDANDVNVLKTYNLELRVLTHLNNNGQWYLMADPSRTGLRYYNREKFNPVTDTEPRTRNYLFMAFYRESHGASHPYGVWGSPGV